MPKFEFDHRTGMMMPKKDEEIYFAGSMGGGLRIDDHKNNVTYIVERDGTITNLAGIRDEKVNLYDMRDARIIADRVLRKFGRNNKYSDYHYFLKGYHMNENIIKSCSDFLDESFVDDLIKRGINDELRIEDGILVGRFEDGSMIIGDSDFHKDELVDFYGDPYYYLEDLDTYIVATTDGAGLDTVYRYVPEVENNQPNLVKVFEVNEELRKRDFDPLKALIKADNWTNSTDLDGLDFDFRGSSILVQSGHMEFLIFFDEDDANDYALDYLKDTIEDEIKDRNELKRYYNIFGDSILNVSEFEDIVREYEEDSYDDFDEEEAIEELLKNEVIDDTDEYFEVDEDGNTDHSQPKFNYKDYKDDYVDKRMNDIGDYVNYVIINWGYDELQYHVDTDKLAEAIIDADGAGPHIAYYDGEEREEVVDGNTYYIYRQN